MSERHALCKTTKHISKVNRGVFTRDERKSEYMIVRNDKQAAGG